MTIEEVSSKTSFDTCLLLGIPEDVIGTISRFLSPSDICNLSLCCKSLRDIVDTEDIWLAQCELVKVLPLSEIVQWRIWIRSYKTLCRFLVEVMKPLVGIWVHRSPELGNVVYVMPGFLSVVGCRIIPQEVGPLGIHEGRVMWSPVFEIICGFDGSNKFFLHGRDDKGSFLYPGFVNGIETSCNVLQLEVEPRKREKSLCSKREEEVSKKVSFGDLKSRDKSKLFELVTSHVGVHVPEGLESLTGRLFPTLKDDEKMSLERRTMLLKMHKFGGNWKDKNLEEEEEDGLCYSSMEVDIHELLENLRVSSWYMKDRESENEDEYHRRFLSEGGDTLGLSLKASSEVGSHLGWPCMDQEQLTLYKLPNKKPLNDQVYAGLWGGTYGWRSGKCTEDDYEESKNGSSDERLLVGTKILEGTDYVIHPNGSRMFGVNIDTPSLEPFPFDGGREFEHSFNGNGISTEGRYGFRCPGWKPGSLFVISNDLLAFVWGETKDVFTLQRLNLEEILKKGLGLCVHPLPPIMNFTCMYRSYTNVFLEASYD